MRTIRIPVSKYLGYRCSIGKTYGGYYHFQIEIIHGHIADAAKEYDAQPETYYLERLEQIRTLGTSTKYLASGSGELEISWQTDRDNWENARWYAPRITTKFSTVSSAFIAKLSKLVGDDEPSPQAVLESLNKLGIRHVFCDSSCPYSAWIFRECEVSPENNPYENLTS